MWWMLLQIFEIDKRYGHKKEIRLTYTDVVSNIWITGWWKNNIVPKLFMEWNKAAAYIM